MSAAVRRLREQACSRVSDRDSVLSLGDLAAGTVLGGRAAALGGRTVLVATATQVASAAAFVELDGLVRRMVIAPPDATDDQLAAFVEDAEVEAIVTDVPQRFAGRSVVVVPLTLPIRGEEPPPVACDTEWVMATSGTAGRPKLVAHSLAALTGAIAQATPGEAPRVWATFYDIRRYGGLQIFLRAIVGGADLILSSAGETLEDHLARLGAAGTTSLSGTPSHWRRVLMSGAHAAIRPSYVRLSGEIADQRLLDALRETFADAAVGHAYASTEAGVGFAVDDGLEGFPAALLDERAAVGMKVVDGTLRIKSERGASRYVGLDAPPLTDADGFVDTGDLVERRGDRYVFVGRRGGIINVGGLKVNPEEVEAAINAHVQVRMSLVQARRNPLTGAIVTADIVLREPARASDALKEEILAGCRERLARHKVPAIVRFVPSLALTPGGKLSRAMG